MLMLRKKQSGISLIEILVGLVIGLIIVAAVTTLFSTTMTSSQQILLKGKLDKELNAAMDTITADVQRTGYWSGATGSHGNPFLTGANDITTNSAGNCPTNGNCFTFSYDLNNTGIVSDANEFGYGYDATNKVIQFRPQGVGADFSCTTKAGWVNLTDPTAIAITAFSVCLTNIAINPSTGTDTTNYRTLTVTITGNLVSDALLTETVTRTIKIYNNKFTP